MAKPSTNRCLRCPWSGPLLNGAVLLAAALVGAVALAGPGGQPSSAVPVLLEGPGLADADQMLYLEIVLNGVDTGRLVQVPMTADGHLHLWPEHLQEIGLRLDDLPADRYLDLAGLPGLTYRYDAPNQRLYLDAVTARLDRQLQTLGGPGTRLWPATVSPGALLNYDIYGTTGEGSRSLAATTELRLFGPHGVLTTTGISRYGGDEERDYVRLDSAWTWSSQHRLLALTVGDFIGGSLSWSRATRLGGVQLRRSFALQPELITRPLPQFFGEAALPSAVELYVGGLRQYQGEVLPGPFQLDTLPRVSGTGQAQVVITDALGRSRTIAFDYYNEPRLLRRGLSDYSLELGRVRADYGLKSFSYRDGLVGSGSLRYGLTDGVTLEAHAEGGDGLAAGGVGAVPASAALAASTAPTPAAAAAARKAAAQRGPSSAWATAGWAAGWPSTTSSPAPSTTTATWRRKTAGRPPGARNGPSSATAWGAAVASPSTTAASTPSGRGVSAASAPTTALASPMGSPCTWAPRGSWTARAATLPSRVSRRASGGGDRRAPRSTTARAETSTAPT